MLLRCRCFHLKVEHVSNLLSFDCYARLGQHLSGQDIHSAIQESTVALDSCPVLGCEVCAPLRAIRRSLCESGDFGHPSIDFILTVHFTPVRRCRFPVRMSMNRLTDTIVSNTEDRVKDSIWFVFNELHAACCTYITIFFRSDKHLSACIASHSGSHQIAYRQ